MIKPTSLLATAPIDDAVLENWTGRLQARVPELDNAKARGLAMAAVCCEVIQGAVAGRSLRKQHAGRKPTYAIAVLLADIVALGVAAESDLRTMSSGSHWESRGGSGALTMDGATQLEECARAVLVELSIHASSLHRQAKHARWIFKQM